MAHVENLIVGGGLAGLSLARLLHRSGQSFALIEARDRLGGRIAGHEADGSVFDLGPAWFWPEQPRIQAIIQELGLQTFEQFSTGAAVYEDQQQRRQAAQGFASMAGSFRVSGGFSAMIQAINAELPPDKILTSQALRKLNFRDGVLTATMASKTFTAGNVILAIPPRVAAKLVNFEPAISIDALNNVSTWMAGHAKAVAIYDSPFWRAGGMSGDAVSQSGPLMEIHDASPASKKTGALFGFIGTPVTQRKDVDALRQEVMDQLVRLFGPQAATPKELVLKDWAYDQFTATDLDHPPLHMHPKYEMPADLKGLYDGRLLFASTETAPEFGGYLEGAIEAAEITFERLSRAL
jgi:monoamine oxidase